ncbi:MULTISPECIES: copper resistance CopC family protein [unclassified Rathayibacter]|uniref:copper resistance CopC family protein n=1 Tax=unclassified Rathayibacter TaxID=2609250 RepID=UPI000CE824F4|nr:MULTISPECIES: copper resistance CopC family protein [unclassified Rathayibacter]PPF37379.1 transporter [Rathayibacter sp. AY1A2]PPH22769.1 transporter [Rathayibacter sp. AY1C4]PPI40156.1 transporter [Rathayibacter sp. RFBD1]PPI58408.1 transporter [Rathayibacter sp. TRS19]
MTRRKALVAATAIGLLGSIAVAAPASAHNYLVSTTPAADSTVTEQPGTLVLTTNDDLLVLGTDGTAAALRVVGPDGLYYGDGCVSVVGPEASMPLELGAAGEYEVTWQVVSTDGHPVSGQYAFDWAPSDGTALADGSDSVPDCNGTVAVSGGQAESADEAQATSGSDPALLGDVLWIGGALAAVAAAIGVTLLVLRRRPRD